MIIFLYSIAAAAILIYVPFLVVAYARVRIGYEMFSTPGAMFDKLPPYAQRATWAHQNAFEAFMIFAVVAFMAYVTGVNSFTAQVAAIAFVVAPFAILNFLYFEYTPFALA